MSQQLFLEYLQCVELTLAVEISHRSQRIVHRWLKDPSKPKLVNALNAVQVFNACCVDHGVDCTVDKVVRESVQSAQREAASETDWRDTTQFKAVTAAFHLVRQKLLHILYQSCGMNNGDAQVYAQSPCQDDNMPLLDLAESTLKSLKRSGATWIKLLSEYRLQTGSCTQPSLFRSPVSQQVGFVPLLAQSASVGTSLNPFLGTTASSGSMTPAVGAAATTG